MATYQYPSLTIIEENDAVRMRIQQLRQTIIARSLAPEAAYISRGNIQAAAYIRRGSIHVANDVHRYMLAPQTGPVHLS